MFGGGAPNIFPTLLNAAAQDIAANSTPTNPKTRASQNRRATSPPGFGRKDLGVGILEGDLYSEYRKEDSGCRGPAT
jgi:hypothetical protein